MITYINEQNASKYEVLFNDATNALYQSGDFTAPTDDEKFVLYNGDGLVSRVKFEKNPSDFYYKKEGEPQPVCCDEEGYVYDPLTKYYVQNFADITTLEQYFSVMKNLIKIEGGNSSDNSYSVIHSKGRRFTMLPLDEDVFEVNANTKEIKVPENFRKNGIAVEGDELAEVVYFEIDRFYDATDLDSVDCYIQWENADREQGVSLPWVIDIESKPNKMIIGWVLSHALTKTPGNIKFSLRFYKMVENQLIFSFSTLTASAAIKQTLSLDIENVAPALSEIEADLNILNRINISDTKVTNTTDIAQAVWDDPTIFPADPDKYPITYFDLEEDKVFNGEDLGAKDFIVQAHSVDGGTVTYAWYKINESGKFDPVEDKDNWVIVDDKYASVEEAIATKKAFYKANYSEDAATPSSYSRVLLTESTTLDELNTYFEKQSSCTVGATGTYVAIATNRKGFATKTVESPKYAIPEPVAFDIKKDAQDAELIYGPAYELKEDTVLSIEIVQNDGEAYPAGTDRSKKAHNAKLSYEWFKNGELIEGANEAIYAPTEPGWYRVKVTNTRNEVSLLAEYADTYVAKAAVAPKLIEVQVDGNGRIPIEYSKIAKDSLEELEKFKVEIDRAVGSWLGEDEIINEFMCGDHEIAEDAYHPVDATVTGNIAYQWYKVKGTEDIKEPKDAEEDILIEGAISSKFDPRQFSTEEDETLDSGFFYCAITNTLANGTSATAYSPIFTLINN